MNQEESILNREGQADGGHTEKTKHQQKGELQKESEPSSSLAIEEATATKSKHKKHKAEKHRKHSHDLSAAADQSPEVHTESKKHKKNKRDKKKKEEKDMHRKHSHDISASLEEKTQTDTKSLKKMEKKQKKKEEKARRKSKDLKTDLPVELPSPEDTKLDKRKEEKAKKHNQVEIIASATMAPPVVEAAPKKHKAEKKRKSSLLPIASIVSAEQDAISVESETTGPVAAEIVSEAASPTHSEDMELPEADNFISALFPGSGSASPDTTTTLPTADVSDGPEENMMSSPAEPESSPEVETTLTPTGKEPEISNGTDSGSNTDIEREDSEAPVTPNMEEPGIADVTDSGASSDVAEEDSEAPMAPNMEKPSFGDATDSGANSDVAEEEVDEVEEKNVASSEQLPDDIASYFPSGSTEHTPEPDVDEIEMQASPVVESREISFEPQATSTPIMIDSPDTSSVNEMEIDTQLEQEVMKVEASTIEQDDDVSASQVEESAEVISSQAILPPSDMNVPISQLDIQPSKTEQEDPDSSSSESSSDDDDDAFGFKALKQLEADNLEQPDESYIQTTINILEDISNDTAKPVDVKAVEAATELRKVCDEEFKARLTRAIKNGGETVKSGKEMEQLKAAQLGDEDDSEDHPISGLLPGFMSKSRAPTLSEIYANSQRYIYKSIHGRSPPPSPSRR
ncbi:hypothetical protein BC943DRAFT_44257 [Umbelopsis sp. AD052]|nr:hypothetical protein BC943DRAFT_44257 [Umbelopsis sp. AD052]